nr:hypothetical protein [Tanacetum cinerariifolium]
MDEEFTTTAYTNVQENLKLPTEDQVIFEEPASSTGTLNSLQNLEKNSASLVSSSWRSHGKKNQRKPMLNQRFRELEQQMANLIQDKSALEERLNKHGSRLYNLENLNIPQIVSKVVDEIVTDVVDWALQAPLRARFKDLLEADMKEILLQRMWETGSYKTHEDHKKLYEALKKSMNRDHSDQLQVDLAEARKKRQKRSDSPRTLSGSPQPQPPPLPPPAGTSSAPDTSRASGSSQLPPPPPPPSTNTNRGNQQQGSGAPSSSKSAASTPQSMAWTTYDTRYESASFVAIQETSPTVTPPKVRYAAEYNL